MTQTPKLYTEGFVDCRDTVDGIIALKIRRVERSLRSVTVTEARATQTQIDILKALKSEVQKLGPTAEDRAERKTP